MFLDKDQAIGYAETRARLRTGEIRVFDSTGNVERLIAFDDANRRRGSVRLAFSCLLTRDKASKLKRRAPRKHVLPTLFYGNGGTKFPLTEAFYPAGFCLRLMLVDSANLPRHPRCGLSLSR